MAPEFAISALKCYITEISEDSIFPEMVCGIESFRETIPEREMAVKECIREVTIKNKLGLHARPASLFVQMASRFDSEITVMRKNGGEAADGKSLMSMLILTASCGTPLTIRGEGPDSEEAVTALSELVDRGFDED